VSVRAGVEVSRATGLLAWLASITATVGACDLRYPEVAIVNQTADPVLIKNPAFNGCVWDTVMANGVATSPLRCLIGDDHVHFQKLDAERYCREQAADGTLSGVCPCDGGAYPSRDGGISEGLVNTVPTWFNYQTITVKHVGYGDFHVFAITLDDMEQDFSVPGPYGH
jgi:hypothetical protein